jgi:hypothetical protein
MRRQVELKLLKISICTRWIIGHPRYYLMKWQVPEYGRAGLYWQVVMVALSMYLLELRRVFPGEAIGVLAFVAVIVAFRAERNRGEQVGWIMIAFFLFVVEIRSIYRDRNEFAENQAAITRTEDAHHEQQMSQMQQIAQTQTSLTQVIQEQRSYSNRTVIAAAGHQNVSPAPSPEETRDLRARSLALAEKMLTFVLGRQIKDNNVYPNGTVVNGREANLGMPTEGKETLSIFAGKFYPDLKDIRDDFSALGLGQGTALDAVARESPEAIGGNPYATLREVAEDIRNIASLLPTPEMYRGVSSARLAEMAIDESNKINDLATAALKQCRRRRRRRECNPAASRPLQGRS